MARPIEQFVVKTLVPLRSVGGIELGMTDAALIMILAVALIVAVHQVYVFTVLTCTDFKDALHPGHRGMSRTAQHEHGDDLSR